MKPLSHQGQVCPVLALKRCGHFDGNTATTAGSYLSYGTMGVKISFGSSTHKTRLSLAAWCFGEVALLLHQSFKTNLVWCERSGFKIPLEGCCRLKFGWVVNATYINLIDGVCFVAYHVCQDYAAVFSYGDGWPMSGRQDPSSLVYRSGRNV